MSVFSLSLWERVGVRASAAHLTRNSNTFHICHIAAQFLTYLLNRMAANRFVHITQLPVIYRAFRNSFYPGRPVAALP
ncbi:Uncharacterised protein [Escherichia coli]|uniref:Uncharacterized protein n=1 Tax=Escherichia coli TaxID=562 RepID=A0A2X1JPF4_ECOLX|nr:Uncharacterised protein [Escherichia coli]